MKFEKLNENKIRIILNIDDLKSKNINFHSFMSNSIETQDLFLDMLDTAEKEMGFVTKDYKIMVEALAMSNGNFVITITRALPEEKTTSKKLYAKRKRTDTISTTSIYKFSSFDEFCDFCDFLQSTHLLNNNTLHKLFKKICLYTYNSNYFLVCNEPRSNTKLIKSFCSYISEFATLTNNSLFEKKLLEYGKLIMKNNAINTCISYFVK